MKNSQEFVISRNTVSYPVKIPKDKSDFIQCMRKIELKQLKRNSQESELYGQIIKTIESPKVSSESIHAKN